MSKPIIGFCIKLLALISIVFSIHITILHFLGFPLFENQIIPSYVINYILAVIIFITLFKMRKKYEHILGFIFMAGSFLKFGVYFIFFYPIFKQNGEVSSIEATSFLIPYFACLIFETFYLVKLMNNKV